MSDLLKRMRAARECWVPLDDVRSICVLRPRWEDLAGIQGKAKSEFVAAFAVGWKGFTEADLLPSGGDIEAFFSAEVCAEWLSDQPTMAGKIADWLIEACHERIKREAEAEKN